ncbi:MAG: FtsX-like permease family protein [Niabella sp.]
MILKIAIRNLLHKPLTSVLCWVLLSVSVGIISLLLLLQRQFEQQFAGNIGNIDMVIGAKGSPLQLILSAVYHIDNPTGNIPYKEVAPWMHHPYVQTAVPLAYGDSYKGYHILGTTPDYIKHYKGKLVSGKVFQQDFEVIAGSTVAHQAGLKIGSRFYSTHGEAGEEHKEFPYTVTGVLQTSGTVLDNLLIGNISSVWHIHEHEKEHHHDHDHYQEPETLSDEEHEHDIPDAHEGNDEMTTTDAQAHGDTHKQTHEEAHHELTAVLLKFRNPMGNIRLPRIINSQTNLMAAVPAIEINRLFSLLGIGISALKNIGWGIMAVSALSVFIVLFQSLKERKYELALMRTVGASRWKLLLLLLLEGVFLGVLGLITGIIICRAILWILQQGLEKEYHFAINPWSVQWASEGWLLVVTIALCIVASLLPALKAWRIDISKTLSHG